MGTWNFSTRTLDYSDEPAYIMGDKIIEDSMSPDADPSSKVLKGSGGIVVLALAVVGYGLYSGRRWVLWSGVALAVASFSGILYSASDL